MSDVDNEVKQFLVNPENVLPVQREKSLWLGDVNYLTDRVGGQSGCVAVEFTDAYSLNEYFRAHPTHLLLHLEGRGNVLVGLVTEPFDEDVQKEFDAFQEFKTLHHNKWTKDREEAKAKREALERQNVAEAEKKAKVRQDELVRLAELGLKHEKNCMKKGKAKP